MSRPTNTQHTRALRRGYAALLALWLLGCPALDESPPAPVDQGAPDDLACSTDPTTHVEILNACTPAQSVDKRPLLPLLRSDGTLPSLP